MTDEQIANLLKTEAEKLRMLCHGYKSIEVSPLLFHYALDQRIQQSDDLLYNLKHNYFDILRKFAEAEKAFPKPMGEITEVRDIYKDGVRPVKKKIREIWQHLFHNIHLPNQRQDERERIMNLKLKRETVAEEISLNNSTVKMPQRPQSERRTALLLSSTGKKESFMNKLGQKLSKNKKYIRIIMKGKKQKDLNKMKEEKQNLLDDSVKYLGKQIDPYSAQHKKDINFYREVLLNDANIVPESRVVISKNQLLKIKEEKFQPKSARELFNKKNFKTASISTFDQKPFDKTKLMKDIDLRPYVPDPSINYMDLQGFKLPQERKFEIASRDMSDSAHTQNMLRRLTHSETNKSALQQSNSGIKRQNSLQSFDKDFEKPSSEHQLEDYGTERFMKRPQSVAESSRRPLSIERHSQAIRDMNHHIQTDGNMPLDHFKSKQLEQFFTEASSGIKQPHPISTRNTLMEAKISLDRQVKEAKQQKIIQMELNKKRNAGYMPEMRRKDIMNQRKKIHQDPIEIDRRPSGIIAQGDLVEQDSIYDLKQQEEALNMSDLSTQKKEFDIKQDDDEGEELMIDREQEKEEVMKFNQRSMMSQDIIIPQKRVEEFVQSISNEDKPQETTEEFKKAVNKFSIRNMRAPSANLNAVKKIQFLNIHNQEDLNPNIQQDKQTTPDGKQLKPSSRLISARVGGSNSKYNKPMSILDSQQNRIMTARDSHQTRGGLISATTRPQTAFNSSYKTNKERFMRTQRAKSSYRMFAPSSASQRRQGSPPGAGQNFSNRHQHTFDKTYSTTITSPRINQKDMIIMKLNMIGKQCKEERKDIKAQIRVLKQGHARETKKMNNIQEKIEQKCMTVIELGQKKDALRDFRYEKHTFIYGKIDQGMGHYLRADGYDRVEVSEKISKLNGKYAFMAENIKI
ncbi:UNKNOWN [Stylonychia lemnae]|uniref:Uncharacterized protein n=1 Tax=Stylonychia lemnae TaxID=5949 RepID=A0A078AZC1_STYLE|nr:UNKNOWN [Stylonychia lemnae]|eukprot:CDW87456.1 UNKNOWN [Stylonychia lemnae]